VEGGRAGDVDVCAEAEGVEEGDLQVEGRGFAREVGGYVVDGGEVEDVDWVLCGMLVFMISTMSGVSLNVPSLAGQRWSGNPRLLSLARSC